jgi:putative acetyltransferase
VRPTHTFLSEADIELLSPKVGAYLASGSTDFFVAIAEDGAIAGFMGLGRDEIESLFLDPGYLRRGIGTRLIDEARALRPGVELLLDVNEQNSGAVAFYEAAGFVVEGRSETDQDGLPFPLLHMRSRRERT